MKGRCCLSGMRGGAVGPVGGVAGAADAAGLAIGSGSVGPPGTGVTLGARVSG